MVGLASGYHTIDPFNDKGWGLSKLESLFCKSLPFVLLCISCDLDSQCITPELGLQVIALLFSTRCFYE